MASLLSTRAGEDVVQVVVQEEETMGLYLVLEELPSGIVYHGEPCGVAPFQEAWLLHTFGGGSTWRRVGPCLSTNHHVCEYRQSILILIRNASPSLTRLAPRSPVSSCC